MYTILGGTWDTVAKVRMATSATTSAIVSFPAYEFLDIRFNIVGYGGSDIASLKFGTVPGTLDTTTTGYYSNYYAFQGTGAPAVPTEFASSNCFRLGQNGVTVGRSGQVTVFNFSGTQHGLTCVSATFSSAATANTNNKGSWGYGDYVSTSTGQIRCAQLFTPGGQTMFAGTSMIILGANAV